MKLRPLTGWQLLGWIALSCAVSVGLTLASFLPLPADRWPTWAVFVRAVVVQLFALTVSRYLVVRISEGVHNRGHRQVHSRGHHPRPDIDPVTGVAAPHRDPGPDGDTERTGAGLEPLRAWKQAHVNLDAQDVFCGFVPLTQMTGYGGEAVAICNNGGTHRAPQRACTCGFYALAARPPYWKEQLNGHTVWLEVELYGRVMVHETGYRAEKQRVLAAYARRDRWWGCSLVIHRDTTMGYSSRCSGTARYVDSNGHHLCATHAVAGPRRFFLLDGPGTPDLGGIEWHWVEP